MEGKSKILAIGGTGYLGKFIEEASAKAGHPTFSLIRESTASNPEKLKLVEKFNELGVSLLYMYGDIYDHKSLVKAIKRVDVVISTVGSQQILDQVKIIAAIKEAGNIKKFLPSEFGVDVDRTHAVDPAATFFNLEADIRRAVEAEGIDYTFVSSNAYAGYFLPRLCQVDATVPPSDKVIVLGDENAKAIFVEEEDIATYTIKAVDDPRTSNKSLYIRPANVLSFKKIGKTLEKVYVPEDQLLRNIKESPAPVNLMLSFGHSMLVVGDGTNFDIDPSAGEEALQLYGEVKYTTVDEFLDQFV